jgi:hypothetical protein
MSKSSGHYFSIGDILERYPNIFLDTNVFFGINLNLNDNIKENYFQLFKIKEQLLDFWIPVLKENSRIYLTTNIFGELKRNPPSSTQEYSEIKEIKGRLKHKRSYFLSEFPLNRIFDKNTIEDKVLYDELYKKYYYFLKSPKHFKGIGENDFDLLLISGIFSKLGSNTCLISNDTGILRCYGYFLREEGAAKRDFGFYIQQGLNFFKKV